LKGYMKNKCIELYEKFSSTWLGKFLIKFNIYYLIFAILLYFIKAMLYVVCASIDVKPHYIHMAIDDKIPFIKYFFVFYFTYYFLPQILLWLLSFYDKRKYFRVFIAFSIACLLSYVVFCFYNVVMIRQPGYGAGYEFPFSEVDSISRFFDYCMNYIYNHDPTAKNCLPSIHAIAGVTMAIIGIFIPSVDKKRMPVWIMVIAIVCGIGCVLSTVFIKQHYFIDVVVGSLLMALCYIGVVLVDKLVVMKRKEAIEIELVE